MRADLPLTHSAFFYKTFLSISNSFSRAIRPIGQLFAITLVLFSPTKKALQPFWGRRAFDFARKPALTLRPILAIDSFLAAEIYLLRGRGGLLRAIRARVGFRRRRLQVPMMEGYAGHYSFYFSRFPGALYTHSAHYEEYSGLVEISQGIFYSR